MTDEGKELDFEAFRVQPEVLETIAARATTQVEGVASLVPAAGARGALGRRAQTRGVTVVTEDERLAVSIHVAVRFGNPTRTVAHAVQEAVADALYRMTAWPVASVEVFVDDVVFEATS
jgi:uncharacterized alkaline shock family protein YloU